MVALAATLSASACGGRKATEAPPPSPTEETRPGVSLLPDGVPEDDSTCLVYFKTVQHALQNHLLRSPDDLEEVLIGAYRYLLLQHNVPASDPRVRNPPAIEGLCDAYKQLAANAPERASPVRGMALHPKENPLFSVLRAALRAAAKQMDLFSSYGLRAAAPRHGWGAGLILHSRTDYLMGRKPNYLVVDQVLSDSANKNSREIGPGTKIFKIGGRPVRDLPFQEAVERINHEFTREVPPFIPVTIESAGGRTVRLKTGKFQRRMSWYSFADPEKKTAWIRLNTFIQGAYLDFIEQLGDLFQDMLEAGGGRLEGLILDLRGNGGGTTEEGEQVLKKFIARNVPFAYATGKGNEEPRAFEIAPGRPFGIDPLVVLVDRQTASMSEAVTAALKDYGRALVVGERTFGKGVGQAAISVAPPLFGELTLTSLYFYSPAGRPWQAEGIEPHVNVEDKSCEAAAKMSGDDATLRMKDLLESETWKGRIAPPPERDLTVEVGFRPDRELAKVTPEIVQRVEAERAKWERLSSCGEVGDPAQIREEDDCLLDVAKQALAALRTLLPAPPRAAQR